MEDSICKFAKKGMSPSQIGVILRDSHGIAQVKSVTGSKILRILKAHGMILLRFMYLCVIFVLCLCLVEDEVLFECLCMVNHEVLLESHV